MKITRLYRYVGVLTIFVLIASCEKKVIEERIQGKYLYEYELLSSYSAQQVKEKLILGSLIFPNLDTLIPSVEFGVDVYSVHYKTSFQSEPIIASGLVCIPKSNLSFPIISFQNGTNTCFSNAPSENPSNNLYSLISIMAGSGYIISIPDYIGFGESEYILHPYHHIESSNAAVTDLLKAAKELIDSKIIEAALNNDLYILGYSQGGWATMSILKYMEENPVEDFSVKAAACGAGAYDLMEMSKHVLVLDEFNNPFYLPYFIESRRQNGILNESLTTYFNEPYASNISDLFDGSLCNSEMNAQFTKQMNELLSADFISGFETNETFAPLRQELEENSIDAWNVQAKLRMYHSTGDKSVPSFLSDNMYNSFIRKGVSPEQLSLIKIDLLDHNDAVIPWGVDALSWINGLEGK